MRELLPARAERKFVLGHLHPVLGASASEFFYARWSSSQPSQNGHQRGRGIFQLWKCNRCLAKQNPHRRQAISGGTSSTYQHCCLVKYKRKEKTMWIKSSLIALGFAGAMVVSTPAPAPAQGVHVGPGGVSVDVGRPRYREHYRGYHDYAYDRRHGGCRTVTIERAGSTRTIRRCD